MAWFGRSDARIRREAADWVARLGEGGNAKSLAAFHQWRDSDPRHAEAFERMSAIWTASGKLSAGAAPAASSTPRAPTKSLALAASLVLVLAIGLALASRLPWSDRRPEPDHLLVLATSVGELREASLPDGSHLVLDSESRIEARYSPNARDLTLVAGRARFAVAHDRRPFLVRAGSSEIEATGTLFDVSRLEGRTSVALLEGRVRVRTIGSRGERTEELRAGQKLVVSEGSRPGDLDPGETRWPGRMLEFDNATLSEAAAIMNRYSAVKLKLGDPSIAALRVSGAYRAGDTAGFARSLAAAFGLAVRTQADGQLLLVHP